MSALFGPPTAAPAVVLFLASSFFLARAAAVFAFARSLPFRVGSFLLVAPLTSFPGATATTISDRIFFTLSCETCHVGFFSLTAA